MFISPIIAMTAILLTLTITLIRSVYSRPGENVHGDEKNWKELGIGIGLLIRAIAEGFKKSPPG